MANYTIIGNLQIGELCIAAKTPPYRARFIGGRWFLFENRGSNPPEQCAYDISVHIVNAEKISSIMDYVEKCTWDHIF